MGDGPRQPDPNETATNSIETVRNLFDTAQQKIAANPKCADNRIVSEVIDQIQTAVAVCHKILSDAGQLQVTRVEYDQTARSLETLPFLAGKYASDPTPQNHQSLIQSSGHIVDRVCQKVLEDCGKKGLQEYFTKVKKTLGDFESLLGILNASASALSSFANVVASNALHEEFQKDADRYQKRAWLWLALAAVSVCILLAHIVYATDVVTQTVQTITANTETPVTSGSTILLMVPRLAISAVIALIAFSFWRNYQSYRHLTVASKAKLNVARIVPLIALNLKQSGEISALHLEFLRQVSSPGDSGFLANAKNQVSVGFGSTKISV